MRAVRITLLSALAFVAVTAVAGGGALVLGSLNPTLGTVLIPPGDYLAGSPFSTYLLPGLALILLVAAPHVWAFLALLHRAPYAELLSAAAGFACLIWIFIQMIYIPFSPLQALYFVLGLLEVGLTLLLLGVLDFLSHRRRSTAVNPQGKRGRSSRRPAPREVPGPMSRAPSRVRAGRRPPEYGAPDPVC